MSASAIRSDLLSGGYSGVPSLSSIGRQVSSIRGRQGPRAPAARVAPPVPVPVAPPEPADPRAELVAAVDEATLPETYGAACLALRRHDDPELDGHMARGGSLVDALTSTHECHSTAYDTLVLLRTPEDIAELAILLTDDVAILGPDDGETEDEYRAWLASRPAAAHARAVALLESAITIVRSRVPA